MNVLPSFVLAVLCGLWYLSTKIMRTTLEALSTPLDKIRLRNHVPSTPEIRPPMRQAEEWAGDHGYQDDIMFDFFLVSEEHGLFCRTWKNPVERTYLVFYFGLGRHFLELVTIYDDKTGVTTTNAPDAHTLPAAPGAFIQSFPGQSLPELYTRHREGLSTLERRTGLSPQERPEETTELIARSLMRQARYVASIGGWQWKGLWWMTVRKKRMIGKDVSWQLDQFGVHEPEPASRRLQ
jgi:hypothetical protein